MNTIANRFYCVQNFGMADLASRITDPNAATATPAAAPAPAEVPPTDAAPGTVAEAQEKDETGLFESNYEVEVKLSDLQNDQSSPLYSVKSFDDLPISSEVKQGLYALNFKKPSKIQERALPLLLADPPRNMIAQSQSGTGKTAAFVLTSLTRVDLSMPTTPQALILGPTRELARQIQMVVNNIGQFCKDLKVEAAVPGNVSRESGVQASIVVGTPGTVMDLIRRRQFNVSKLKVLVVDEADNMLDQQGLGEQCVRVRG
jgi:ATP-dependent RNA helicase DDX19/DBP5